MKFSDVFVKTLRDVDSSEVSKNARLLTRAGYIYKEMSGVYVLLPFGFRVLNKIRDVIRNRLNEVGGIEMQMTALQSKSVWEKTGRWDDDVVDVWFKTKLRVGDGVELGLAFTHEEPMANMMTRYIGSYRDLPVKVYQFQTKFRNEERAKSGILRGREFEMNDMYSFARNREEHDEIYESVKEAYIKIFNDLGVGDRTYVTLSSGGSFSKYSHEFQMVSEVGEDVILVNDDLGVAINKDDFCDEILEDFGIDKGVEFVERRSIEVGDIYTLGYKYSEAFDLKYMDNDGSEKLVFMGSYGIGVTRLMGALVEAMDTDDTLLWDRKVSPFDVHMISFNDGGVANEVYEKLSEKVDVLWDDRDTSMGEKLNDYDLIGVPVRIIVSKRSLENGGIEVYMRDKDEVITVGVDEVGKILDLIR